MPQPKPKKMTLRQQETAAKAKCHDWNAKHQESVAVEFENIRGSGDKLLTKTCGQAFVMCCEAVVLLEDFSGAVHLDHCTVVEQEKLAIRI